MNTSLISYNKIILHEFDPLINPRTHLMKGSNSNILNKQFREEYETFINYLLWKPRKDWNVGDSLALVYYLLLQDR